MYRCQCSACVLTVVMSPLLRRTNIPAGGAVTSLPPLPVFTVQAEEGGGGRALAGSYREEADKN